MPVNHFNISGLTEEQVQASRKTYGLNTLAFKKESGFLDAVKRLIAEPMVILLLVAATIYFISGKIGDGIFLAAAIVLVATISLYQDTRSRNALEKLKEFTQPGCKVIRNGLVVEIKTQDLVMEDNLLVEEGTAIPADGTIIHSNDFSINESILTGESLAVYKEATSEDNIVYQGTTVASGLAIVRVTAIGLDTRLGKIGKSLGSIVEEKTPLEVQINNFVKKMVMVGTVVFLVVWGINFFKTQSLLDSLLKALTLAMSILPEEIPVAFTTFMALGAWRLMKMGIVVKQMKTVETLGSATVICTDKTGTITENKMSLASIFVLANQKYFSFTSTVPEEGIALIRTAMWASEPLPFDPMEVALHEAYAKTISVDERPNFNIVKEYALGGLPPMMTHIFEDNMGARIIAAKGAPEAMINVSDLHPDDCKIIEEAILEFALKGYRVLGVGEAHVDGEEYPQSQQEIKFTFKGLIAFYDPPKQNITKVLNDFHGAGIKVKIVTGDNAATTKSIAKQVGFRGYEKSINGDDLMQLNDADLVNIVEEYNLFTRMFPEAKLKIINALKSNHEIVAMTGDGVNDGPALKAAHIGVAMGRKGTEIAKQAASLILLEDDLSKMVDAIAMGRKIYSNLKKAIQYIISIHIPIVMTVFIPLVLGWVYPNIFSPIHIIFMELVMGPTCSIIYENEPMEKNILTQNPRPFTTTFFNWKELTTSMIQGIAISLGTLGVYQWAIYQGYTESLTRTMVFTALISSNIFLTLVNRSFYYSIFTTSRYKNNLVWRIIVITIMIAGMLLYIKPLADFFEFESLKTSQLLVSVGIGFIVVIWYEFIKWFKRANRSSWLGLYLCQFF